jgi:hypothetical protein
MSSSPVPVTINQTIMPPGPVSPANGGEALPTAPPAGLLDEAAVRLLADFFLLLAEWDRKQKNRDLGATLPGTTIRDGMAKDNAVATKPTQINPRFPALESRASSPPLDMRSRKAHRKRQTRGRPSIEQHDLFTLDFRAGAVDDHEYGLPAMGGWGSR